MPSYDFFCDTCESLTIEQFPFRDRPEKIQCACGSLAAYQIGMPMVLKASYPDGHKRKGWSELREANKLIREAAKSNHGTAKEIRNEIKKMKVNIEK